MSGILYLCSTPIGNLEDISFRAIKTLKEVDLIAAEDTRHSIKLLNYYGIKTPMTSYHEFNKIEKAKYLIQKLLDGQNIALITDAGTPGISDPGEELVKQAHQAGIMVTAVPGACAAISALILSGLSTRRFCFEAFLPEDKKERARILEELKNESRTIVLYEAPHRLKKTLKELLQTLGDRRITIIKELTKRHETIWQTKLSEAVDCYEENEPKGEYVLVLDGISLKELQEKEQKEWHELSLEEHMSIYQEQGLDKKEAMKAVAKDRGLSKREIYSLLIDDNKAKDG
ncbi:MAG: 16S rRNA (cytidine(1402)-2'-O)-methyltransferase [Clostridiales bacterium]|nr:16S rRNA (cytidine(1402)-2'-O)-methyltransferase [Clostridiales bacterium]